MDRGRILAALRTQNERRFTRYGIGDFLREDRDYDLVFRIWPGTQRLLLWGDPGLAAGIGRLGTIGGARGVELCEPLTFRGRKTTGTADGRDPYLDAALRVEGGARPATARCRERPLFVDVDAVNLMTIARETR